MIIWAKDYSLNTWIIWAESNLLTLLLKQEK